ncbi:hypothetical protein JRC49_10855 [Clostridiales bacterium FE2011]|nr:hypothetical protein JRC49_10855 [Clostridiales bacterium FE2011]
MLWGKRKDVINGTMIEESKPDYKLFEDAVISRRNDDAVVIGSNLLNQDPKNEEFFNRFFNWLCDSAMKADDILTKEGYYGLASDVCSSFALLMHLNQDSIELVTKCREKLKEVEQNRLEAQAAAENTSIDKIISHNKMLLNNIKDCSEKVNSCNCFEDLEKLSQEVVKYDQKIQRDYMPEIQTEYDEMMKEISERISERSQTLRMRDNIKINQKAVETYRNILVAFHKREADYTKKEADISGFYSELDLAAQYIDSDLFPETLAYYSYVYNYILSAVHENQKYDLTLHMIQMKGVKSK